MVELKVISENTGRLTKQQLLDEMAETIPLFKACLKGESEYKDSLGWLDPEEWAGDAMLKTIEGMAETIRKDCDAFVVIGVGGSNNACRSVIRALAPDSRVEILYAGNTLSAHALSDILRHLKGKRFAIDCIAKNFETLEPGSSFRILRRMMREQDPEYASRVYCTGTPGSRLEELCRENGFTFLPFPENIGGRYTAVSPVHLLPMAVAGIDIRELAAGACDMRKTIMQADPFENPALRYACMRQMLRREGYQMEMLCSFEPQLRWFFKWWIQLFAESEGKENTGLFPVSAEYSEELHSVGQYVQEGTPLLFETFLNIRESESLPSDGDGLDDGFAYLDGKDFSNINRAAFLATVTAHSKRFPCLVLTVDCLNAATFGGLFWFFEFSCYLSARIAGVNPFDQPGVEAYKTCMFGELGKR